MSEITINELPLFDDLDELLPLKNDYMFRKVFGDPADGAPLRSFLEAVDCLTKDELDNLVISDPHLESDDPKGKRGVPDLIVRANSGTGVHIELQVLKVPFFDRRVLFYIAAEIARRIKAGESWGEIGRMISILIIDWNMTNGEAFHKVFHIRDDKTGELFSNALEIHVMELKRLPEDGGGSLCDWLKMIAAERSDDMEAIAARSPEIKKVYMKVRHLSSDENTRIIIAAREREARDWLTRMVEARKDGVSEGEVRGEARGRAQGLAEGRAEGKAEGKAEGIISMGRKFRVPYDDIILQLVEELNISHAEAERLCAADAAQMRNSEFGIRN